MKKFLSTVPGVVLTAFVAVIIAATAFYSVIAVAVGYTRQSQCHSYARFGTVSQTTNLWDLSHGAGCYVKPAGTTQWIPSTVWVHNSGK